MNSGNSGNSGAVFALSHSYCEPNIRVSHTVMDGYWKTSVIEIQSPGALSNGVWYSLSATGAPLRDEAGNA